MTLHTEQKENPMNSSTPIRGFLKQDNGMTTAEYAVGTIAAAALAVVLLKVVNDPAVQAGLSKLISDSMRWDL